MAITLYDLTLDTKDEIWSPNTLKARIALNIKGLEYETEWLTFFDVHSKIPDITKTGVRPTVPVIVQQNSQDDDHAVQDSWEIVKYLDTAYPNTPRLIKGDNEGLQFFLYKYIHISLLFPIFKLCLFTIHKKCSPQPIQDWFRENREATFKMTLEQFAGDPATHLASIKSALGFVHTTLQEYPYLNGEKVGFADVTLASCYKMLATLRQDIF
ncbi:hypothetical protein BCR42DRAFT_418219 [Absidia repens]|uniref:Uncharacterized protein n=1 Tax=Absidia repens TaxID=90262 RepID=A0A1X2ID66_9FUNG|nr:hypothetical protein BCR42DRAFT_418219 [Absidia repens]